MLTFTGGRSLYATLTNNLTSTNLTTGDTLIANSTRELLAERNWDFIETVFPAVASVSQQQAYTLPSNIAVVKSIITTIGTTQYFPKEVPSWAFWQNLNETTSYYSDITEWWVFMNGQVLLWPTPASTTSGFMTITAEQRVIDSSVADYTTGTITTATKGGATIVGSGTTWTSAMAGRWIQIPKPTGDGLWYQILSVQSTTSLTIVGNYNGTSIAAGSSTYTIGEVSLIPETYQMIPVLDAVYYYFSFVQPDKTRASEAMAKRMKLYNDMVNKFGKKSTSPVIDYGERNHISNPNLTIRG